MEFDESQKYNGSNLQSKEEGKHLHFASLVDLCHLKDSELESRFQKYKGRVVL